jgi:asparagine synthase (glutamine-hydrolysing)
MCGIYGTVFSQPGQVDKHRIEYATRLLTHRGPDDEGYYVDEYAGLGMRRLSIIDLLTGQQPIANEDRTLWLIFNGEIYNYQTLRRQLASKGHVFASQGDAEVIVHAYEEYGESCVDLLNGMFAFAVWNARERRLILARDRLGIKPLYYWTNGRRLIFASELKAIIADPRVPRELDLAALDQFLTLEYIPGPRTIFQGIRKLLPGHWLAFQGGVTKLEQYWDVTPRSLSVDERTCEGMLIELIDDAVRLRLVSDVPLGAFLSGGIDSGTVVASMHSTCADTLNTFSIGFDDATYNELPYARAVATRFGAKHCEEVLQPDIAELAVRLVGHLDEPFGDFSIFPTYLVSQLAKSAVKVVLSGDGGDELFGGYDTYLAQWYDSFYRHIPARLRQKTLPSVLARVRPQPAKKGALNTIKRFVTGGALPGSLQHTRWMMFMNSSDKTALYRPELREALNGDTADSVLQGYFERVAGADPLTQQQYVDLKTYLADDILTKVDRMSMAASVETRVPLLDHRLVEFALSLPADMKLRRGKTKVILRKAMNGRLPRAVLNKPKQGFSIPLKHWLRGPLRPLMEDLLSTESVRRRGYFECETVSRWVTEHMEQRANHSHRIWALMVFELWHRQVQDKGNRHRELAAL